eukprot:COSAG02_NODE_3311_length_6956_cov_3.255359_3_plen_505_part_00
MPAARFGYDSSSTPLFADPVFDAAHDPELVWSEREQTWWVAYLQNRYNSPLSDPAGGCPYCSLTDIGLASTPDSGRTWIYRGVARGLDLPAALREPPVHSNGTQQFGGATWYRPAILKTAKSYHGFWVYSPASPDAHSAQFKVVHYMSENLKNWSFVGIVPGDHGYDSVVYHTQPNTSDDSRSRFVLMSTNSPRNQAFESNDLLAWRPINASNKELNRQIGEGPHVMEWHGSMWLNWEGCVIPYRSGLGCITGPGLLRSDDGGESWLQVSPMGKFPQTEAWIKSDSKPYVHTGKRKFDRGEVHQGPILVQGDRAFKLYMAEFPLSKTYCNSTSDYAFHCYRSVLQLAEVQYVATGGSDGKGSLSLDRNAPFHLELVPPAESAIAGEKIDPTVWHVTMEDAMVIALAEINRWVPTALFPQQEDRTTTQRLWRNPDTAAQYFSLVEAVGAREKLVWVLGFEHADATTGAPLMFNVTVHGNGTILKLVDTNGVALSPIKQFYRPLPL